tara:strand:+ start:508 stop:1296 length:789 start_codon:yes stop_codon:yes gene_type:complete
LDFRLIKKVKHYVFSDLDEYFAHFGKEAPTPNTDWKTASQGDWVEADDGGIVQLLKVSTKIKHPHDRKNYKNSQGWVRTVVGTFLIKDKTFMDSDFDQHKNRYTFSKTIRHPSKRVVERKKATHKEKEFATHIVAGAGAVKAYMNAFNEDDEDKAKKKSIVLLKQRRVMQEVEASALEVASKLGIDHEYILSSLKCIADNSEDNNTQLQAVKELGKAIGTLGGQKKIETGVVGLFQGFSPEQLEGVKRKLPERSLEDVADTR